MSTDREQLRTAAIGFLDESLPAIGNYGDGPGYAIEYFDPVTREIGDADRGTLHAFEQKNPWSRPRPVPLGRWIRGIAAMNLIDTHDAEINTLVDIIEIERQDRQTHG